MVVMLFDNHFNLNDLHMLISGENLMKSRMNLSVCI